ncbi:MAG: isocitrate dehydrogenase [Oceanicaulis sp. HLUCCA04]|nr:MAG: isocitrate dehydrogenase [Oceanicaulis sp. HLUCCA04]
MNKPVSRFHMQSATALPSSIPVSVAWGDGIGPDIMDACLRIMLAAGAPLQVEPVEIGERVYQRGVSAGIEPAAWDSLRRTRLFFKAPITTPQGGGFKSLNVTVRKSLGLFANVRPCRAYTPFVESRHPRMDVVIIRENEEDLYAGIEHRQSEDVIQCLKLISRPGCERIARYAFEYARANGRSKVSCFTKDNIMKMTDGLFRKVFEEVAADYPDIRAEHMIVDIGAARLADTPEMFDVVLLPNLYGDILSDVAAQIAGSVGLAPSANIGAGFAMFEAIHGSAPDLAGKGVANPSGLLLAGAMMLQHAGRGDIARIITNAWLRTLEDGVVTADICAANGKAVGTEAFAGAVIERLGEGPRHLKPAVPAAPMDARALVLPRRPAPQTKKLVGIDVFVCSQESPEEIARRLQAASNPLYELALITNRGVKVWPGGLQETFCTDHWRCRFLALPDKQFNKAMIVELLRNLTHAGVDFIKTEHLYEFDGVPGFSMGQGQ